MIPTNSPFYAIVRYRATKLAYESAPQPVPSAKAREYVRGTFGTPEGTIVGMGPAHWAPKVWNGPKFSSRHGGAYSKAGPVLVPIKDHNLQGGKFQEPIKSKRKAKP